MPGMLVRCYLGAYLGSRQGTQRALVQPLELLRLLVTLGVRLAARPVSTIGLPRKLTSLAAPDRVVRRLPTGDRFGPGFGTAA